MDYIIDLFTFVLASSTVANTSQSNNSPLPGNVTPETYPTAAPPSYSEAMQSTNNRPTGFIFLAVNRSGMSGNSLNNNPYERLSENTASPQSGSHSTV